MAGIWQRNPPANKKISTEAHLASLGVDINDIWICAAALEHNITLVTEDRMACIKDAAGTELRCECWI